MTRTLIIIFFSFVIPLKAQIDVSAGMGINFFNSSTLRDYVNVNFASPGNNLSTFNSAIEFFSEFDYSISPNFELGFEYIYMIYSYNNSLGGIGIYDIAFIQHKPSLLAYYVIPGKGFKLKFGGGIGYRNISLDEKRPNFSSELNYSSSGIGFLIKTVGHTFLGGNFYANIGTEAKLDLPGNPKRGNDFIIDESTGEKVNLNSFSLGIYLGISYFF